MNHGDDPPPPAAHCWPWTIIDHITTHYSLLTAQAGHFLAQLYSRMTCERDEREPALCILCHPPARRRRRRRERERERWNKIHIFRFRFRFSPKRMRSEQCGWEKGCHQSHPSCQCETAPQISSKACGTRTPTPMQPPLWCANFVCARRVGEMQREVIDKRDI